MEESSYKHNYEYLSIEEAKSIISGTFVQGTTSIGGELATKSDIDKLLTTADKRLTSMVPSTVASNEFVCFFECVDNRVDPTGVHVTNIIIQVGQNQKIQYELTPSNATVDTCTYEVTSGSEYVHITDGVVYADAIGEATCKITINGNIVATFVVTVTNNQTVRFVGNIYLLKNAWDFDAKILFYHKDYLYQLSDDLQDNDYMIHPTCFVEGLPASIWTGIPRTMLIDLQEIKNVYQKIKDEPSLIRGKTVEQACEINGGHYVKIEFVCWNHNNGVEYPFVVDNFDIESYSFEKYSNSSIVATDRLNHRLKFVNCKQMSEKVRFSAGTIYGNFENYSDKFDGEHYSYTDDKKQDLLITDSATCIGYILVDLDAENQSIYTLVKNNGSYIRKGYPLYGKTIKEPNISITTNSMDSTGDTVKINATINSVNGKTDITSIRGGIYALCVKDGETNGKRLFGYDDNGAYCWFNQIDTLPYTTQINIPKEDYKKIQLKAMYYDTSEEKPVRYASKDTPLIDEITL